MKQPKTGNQPHGMVTSPHHLASKVGRDVLKRGGNAIEAFIAMGSCLAVVYPHFTGLGGDSFLLVADQKGNTQSISGIGQCAETFPDIKGSIPLRGGSACLTTAATVEAMGKAYELSRERYGGKLSWPELLRPAIEFAEFGFPLSASQHFWMDFRSNEADLLPDVYRLFGEAGNIEIGSTVRQPELCGSLKILAKRGYRDFYEGELADRILEGLDRVGSPLAADDLKSTQARLETPLELPYRDGVLLTQQPPTQGVTTLEIMGILEHFDFTDIEEGGFDYYHLLIEAIKIAFTDRNANLADPDFYDVPVSKWLSKNYLSKKAHSIDRFKASPWPHLYQPADTVFLAATDRNGLCVSSLQTIFYDWGSGVTAGDTGILWHNRGAAFSPIPTHPNAIQSKKRPFHTLNPGIFLKDGKPTILFGTQGADGQPQTLATILTRLIDYHMSPVEALTKPRFLLGKTFSNTEDSLKIEQDIGEDVTEQLCSADHEVVILPKLSPLAGQAGVIKIDYENASIEGAHDPRGEGSALKA